MRIALAADHGGFDMKELLIAQAAPGGTRGDRLRCRDARSHDDYPDYVVPLARAVAAGEVDRGIVICGSGVGAPWPPTRSRVSGPVCATTIIPSARGSKTTT